MPSLPTINSLLSPLCMFILFSIWFVFLSFPYPDIGKQWTRTRTSIREAAFATPSLLNTSFPLTFNFMTRCFQAYASLRSLFLLTSVNLVTLGFSDAVARVPSMPRGRGGPSHSSPIPASGLALSRSSFWPQRRVFQVRQGVVSRITSRQRRACLPLAPGRY